MKQKRNWYRELSSRLDAVKISRNNVELSNICNKIAWCWKWKRISDVEKDKLCEYAIECWELCV